MTIDAKELYTCKYWRINFLIEAGSCVAEIEDSWVSSHWEI